MNDSRHGAAIEASLMFRMDVRKKAVDHARYMPVCGQ